VGKERREDLVATFRDIGKPGDRTGKTAAIPSASSMRMSGLRLSEPSVVGR